MHKLSTGRRMQTFTKKDIRTSQTFRRFALCNKRHKAVGLQSLKGHNQTGIDKRIQHGAPSKSPWYGNQLVDQGSAVVI